MAHKVFWNGDAMRMLIRFAILMGATICTANFGGPQSALAQEKIHWQSNPHQAANQAAEENKLVLLHFTADWCAPCQTQKRFVFSDPTVAKTVNQSVVPVLVDIDVNRELAGELGVKTIPFDVFLTPGGEVVSKRRSPSDTQNFIKMVTSTRTVGTAPKSGALAKLAELKRRFDPMSLPRDQRGNFGVEAPEQATVGVSKEAMGLGVRSNYGDQMAFQKRASKGNTQSGVNSDLQAVFGELERRKGMEDVDPDSSNPFFEIPASRTEQPGLANVSAAGKVVSNPMSPQPNPRSYENIQRQEFLARDRAEIEIPRQPTDVKPVRIMNENFLAAQAEFGSSSLKPSTRVPGLSVSDMVDARSGRTIATGRNSGRSVARFKTENPEPLPSNEVRIVPRREDRIAGHAVDSSFASQATLKRETSASTAKLAITESARTDTANADVDLALGNQMATEPNASGSKSGSGESDFCLQGKCPVALVLEGKWVDGDARWGIVHRDRTYLFSSEENYRLFQQRPDHFSPVLAAYDPVAFHDSGNFVDGLEENGVFMEKDEHQQIVLFSTAANREKFQTNPHLYMRSVRKAIYTASRVDLPSNVDGADFR